MSSEVACQAVALREGLETSLDALACKDKSRDSSTSLGMTEGFQSWIPTNHRKNSRTKRT
jgi:hypothetical protein